MVYDPLKNDSLDLQKNELVDSCDGSNAKITVTNNENALFSMINKKLSVDPSVFEEYVKSDFYIELIKNS